MDRKVFEDARDTTERLTQAVSAFAPVVGVSIADRAAGDARIDFAPEATDDQRAAAQAALDAFDWSDEALAAWRTARQVQAGIALYNSNEAIPLAVRAWLELFGEWINRHHAELGHPPRSRDEVVAEWVARMSGTYIAPPA